MALGSIKHPTEAYLHVSNPRQATNGTLSTTVFSFGLVSMLACTIYTLVSQGREYLLSTATLSLCHQWLHSLRAYHYWRIFNSFSESSEGMAVKVSGDQGAFNEAYRYVDWLLTVPLLLVEVIAVLALAAGSFKVTHHATWFQHQLR